MGVERQIMKDVKPPVQFGFILVAQFRLVHVYDFLAGDCKVKPAEGIERGEDLCPLAVVHLWVLDGKRIEALMLGLPFAHDLCILEVRRHGHNADCIHGSPSLHSGHRR